MLNRLTLAAIAAFGLMTASANATPALFQLDANIDGTVTLDTGFNGAPAEMDDSLFNYGTGLGDIKITLTSAVNGVGTHYVGLLFDHDFDEPLNTFFNEYGEAVDTGLVATGQSWEIDEPGAAFGNIIDNFDISSLDNTNSVPIGLEDDVSMAMAFDFSLAVDQIAMIMFSVSETAPTGGFYLAHTDPDSDESIYLVSSLDIRTVQVPEPGTLALLGLGLMGAAGLRRRWKRS